jgi:endonuclease/exonuclease/phosphatase family metal-dependent hydrolase
MKSRGALISIVLLSAFSIFVGEAGSPGPQLRVLTYNIHHGEGRDGLFDYARLGRIIAGARPDVVALQEVDRGTTRANRRDQAEILGEITEMDSAFGRAMYYQEGEYGGAILSRYPLENLRTHSLPYRIGSEPRVAIEVTLEPGNGLPRFIFSSTHLCNSNEAVRTDQTARLQELFGTSTLPVVLGGDFNSRSDRPPMEVLFSAGWLDATKEVSRIDYILLRQADPWKVIECLTLDEPVASDHLPVLAVLEWEG